MLHQNYHTYVKISTIWEYIDHNNEYDRNIFKMKQNRREWHNEKLLLVVEALHQVMCDMAFGYRK